MERAHRHASELTKSSIDVYGDVHEEVIAAATDHLQVSSQVAMPASIAAPRAANSQLTLREVGARNVSDAEDGRRLITSTVSSWM